MRLERVEIASLRNIEAAAMYPGPGLNWLVGDNGAGKTSILEGIYLLARGSSFRASRVHPVIRNGSRELRVYAQGTKDSGAEYSVGIERTESTCRARINGETVNRLSDLASGLPLQIVGPNSFHILDRGPSFRRRLLDWGVFHVEHAYKNWYADYERCLRQRNAALRQGVSDFWIWDPELARTGDRINIWRKAYTVRLGENFQRLAEGVSGFAGVTFRYSQGWPSNESLAGWLERSRSTDRRRGYSTGGIHTADLQVMTRGRLAVDILSRGEQKLLVVLIHLAQGATVQQCSGEKPILLIDDLPSELDDGRRAQLADLLRAGGWQCFITSLHPRDGGGSVAEKDRVFHVKHGRILT